MNDDNSTTSSLTMADYILHQFFLDPLLRHTEKPKKHKTYPTKVVFNDPMTLVEWSDGTETRAVADGDEFNELEGFNICCLKKKYGSWDKCPKNYKPIRVIRVGGAKG